MTETVCLDKPEGVEQSGADPTAETASDVASGDRRTPPRAPGWVKVFGIVAALVVLLFLILLLTGNNHRPGRHLDGEEKPPGVEHTRPHP